jgi:hypothetical protein
MTPHGAKLKLDLVHGTGLSLFHGWHQIGGPSIFRSNMRPFITRRMHGWLQDIPSTRLLGSIIEQHGRGKQVCHLHPVGLVFEPGHIQDQPSIRRFVVGGNG